MDEARLTAIGTQAAECAEHWLYFEQCPCHEFVLELLDEIRRLQEDLKALKDMCPDQVDWLWAKGMMSE